MPQSGSSSGNRDEGVAPLDGAAPLQSPIRIKHEFARRLARHDLPNLERFVKDLDMALGAHPSVWERVQQGH